ncbi:MAG: TlpA family protein disulfide reductase [Bacteroidetes bacterium]|nr:TlpA family protein disulfide reductase [Bacteroidota bacterium]
MSKKATYIILVIAVLGVVGLYFYNKYNVAPTIAISKLDVVDQDTNKFDIQSLKGKKVIVSFYASWCPNCIQELKELNSIKQQKLSDVEVLAITDESIEKLVAFKTKTQYPFTFLTLTGTFPDIGINSIPVTYLLNTKGEIVYNNVGYIEWNDESTLEHLKSLME